MKPLATFLLAVFTGMAAAGQDADKTPQAKPPIPTRLQTLDYDINVEVWATGLEVPWSIAFLDGETALITERPGRLRIVEKGKLLSKPVNGIPKVVAEGEGGLLDVAFDPDYAASPSTTASSSRNGTTSCLPVD